MSQVDQTEMGQIDWIEEGKIRIQSSSDVDQLAVAAHPDSVGDDTNPTKGGGGTARFSRG
jgi:hypothetical protein